MTKKRTAAIHETDAALEALGHQYRVELKDGPWDEVYSSWACTRVAQLLDHLTGWRPVSDEDAATQELRDKAIDALCRLWLEIRASKDGDEAQDQSTANGA